MSATDEQIRALVAQGFGSEAIAVKLGMKRKAVIYAVAARKLGTWRRANCRARKDVRPMPADFPDHAARMMQVEVQRHYGCGWGTIKRWYEAAGLQPLLSKSGKMQLSPPGNLAELADGLSERAVAEKCGVHRDVVRRWIKDAGLRSEKRRTPAAPVANTGAFRANLSPVDRPSRDMSQAGQAADFLRRLGPVYRCDDRGRADLKGTFWRRGSAILTDGELIERAERNGWVADSWAKVA